MPVEVAQTVERHQEFLLLIDRQSIFQYRDIDSLVRREASQETFLQLVDL